MKSCVSQWEKLEWDDIRLRINSKTAADVEWALNATESRSRGVNGSAFSCRSGLS